MNEMKKLTNKSYFQTFENISKKLHKLITINKLIKVTKVNM